jgi:predicted Zn-dependent peptidase
MHFKIHRKILDNNLHLVLIPMNHIETVSIGIFVKVGSRYEIPSEQGLAHFYEHMIFRGTKTKSGKKIQNELDSMAIRHNAYTGVESTSYYLYGHRNHITPMIELISDLYKNPAFNADDIENERKVVIEELNMVNDDPNEILRTFVYETIFDNSPLGLPIVGTKESLMKIKKDNFTDFYKKHYLPDRTAVVVAGNFDLKKVAKLLVKRFEYKAGPDKVTIPYSKPKLGKGPKLYVKKNMELAQTMIQFNFLTDDVYSKNHFVYKMIGEILAGSIGSRLYEQLRNKMGLTYYVNAFNVGYMYEGLFTIGVGVDHNRIDEAIDAIDKQLGRLIDNGVTDRELEVAKNSNITSLSIDIQTSQDVMFFYGDTELCYMIGDKQEKSMTKISTHIEKYRSVTKKMVDDVMKELFDEKNRYVFVHGRSPKHHKEKS